MSLLKANDVLTAMLDGWQTDDLRAIDISFGVLIRDLQRRIAELERKEMARNDDAV